MVRSRTGRWARCAFLAGFLVTACHRDTTGPIILDGAVYVAVTARGQPAKGLHVEIRNAVDVLVYTTDANGVAAFFIAGSSSYEVLVEVPDTVAVAPGYRNPDEVAVDNGERVLHYLPLVGR